MKDAETQGATAGLRGQSLLGSYILISWPLAIRSSAICIHPLPGHLCSLTFSTALSPTCSASFLCILQEKKERKQKRPPIIMRRREAPTSDLSSRVTITMQATILSDHKQTWLARELSCNFCATVRSGVADTACCWFYSIYDVKKNTCNASDKSD